MMTLLSVLRKPALCAAISFAPSLANAAITVVNETQYALLANCSTCPQSLHNTSLLKAGATDSWSMGLVPNAKYNFSLKFYNALSENYVDWSPESCSSGQSLHNPGILTVREGRSANNTFVILCTFNRD
jgi:hypothetical protein